MLVTVELVEKWSHICDDAQSPVNRYRRRYAPHFVTSLVLDLLAMLLFRLKLHMVVTTKALLLLYNIEHSTIHEAWNAKELCVFENAASSGPFYFLYNMPFSLDNKH